MKRRSFIHNSTVISASLMLPGFLKLNRPSSKHTSWSGKKLIVIQLSGGNDGLNTIVPFENDDYYNARPGLAISSDELIKIGKGLGFHPSLASLENWYKDGYISIVNGVGYPNPDRSHFRSMDIWHTGSSSNEYWSTGWLGRYLDNHCNTCDSPHSAIQIGTNLSLGLKGDSKSGFALTNPKQVHQTASNKFLELIGDREKGSEKTHYLYKTLVDTQESAKYIFEKSKTYSAKNNFPKNPFSRQLKLIAELMTADLDTQIYYAELGGFDTHANQKNTQSRLLKIFADSLNAFLLELKHNSLLNDTLILVFSEFGRRVAQNASAGTDHGTANNVWLISGQPMEKGIFNLMPSLTDLDNGDLKFSIDFRSIYAEILSRQLNSDPRTILGREFKSLGILQ